MRWSWTSYRAPNPKLVSALWLACQRKQYGKTVRQFSFALGGTAPNTSASKGDQNENSYSVPSFLVNSDTAGSALATVTNAVFNGATKTLDE